jgi:acetophenone carboxylase
VLFNDTIGADAGLVRIPTTIIKEDDELLLLVEGVSPENGLGPMHCSWHLTRASMAVYLFTYMFRGLPPNIGLFDPVSALIEGPSVANCTDNVAHGEGTSIAALNGQNLHLIGSKMLFGSPHRMGVSAPFSRNVLVNIHSGVNGYGYRTASSPSSGNAAGQGARADMDGEHACGFYWASLTDAGEIEELDMRLPAMTLTRRLDKDVHGFGKFRGGSPAVEIDMAPPVQGCLLTSWGSADRLSHNLGLFGGYAAPPNPRFTIRGTNVLEMMANSDPSLKLSQYELAREEPVQGTYVFEESSHATEAFKPGDLFIYNMGGGGGYGDVLERDPEMVMEDLQTGVISDEVARRVYRVVFDAATGQLDLDATTAARQHEREERKRRGKPFAEFIKQWQARRPSDDKLKYYGHWPEPRLERYEKPFWGIYD